MYVVLEITYFFKLNDLLEIKDRKYLFSRHIYGHHKLKCCSDAWCNRWMQSNDKVLTM